jgi:hypothetical protein
MHTEKIRRNGFMVLLLIFDCVCCLALAVEFKSYSLFRFPLARALATFQAFVKGGQQDIDVVLEGGGIGGFGFSSFLFASLQFAQGIVIPIEITSGGSSH